MDPLIERNRDFLLDKIKSRTFVDENGCWIWKGARAQGYGVLTLSAARGGPRGFRVHRLSYELLAGEVPADLHVDHLCRVRACCNPEHLEPVTPRENMLRTPWVTKTECVNGHPRTPENQYRWKNQVGCRPCRLANTAAWRQRVKKDAA